MYFSIRSITQPTICSKNFPLGDHTGPLRPQLTATLKASSQELSALPPNTPMRAHTRHTHTYLPTGETLLYKLSGLPSECDLTAVSVTPTASTSSKYNTVQLSLSRHFTQQLLMMYQTVEKANNV